MSRRGVWLFGVDTCRLVGALWGPNHHGARRGVFFEVGRQFQVQLVVGVVGVVGSRWSRLSKELRSPEGSNKIGALHLEFSSTKRYF